MIKMFYFISQKAHYNNFSDLHTFIRCLFQISVLTNFDFLYDESEDSAWGPEYEDRRLSYCMDVGSLDRDMKSNLQTLECLSGSEQDLTPHDSSDDEDEVLRCFLST